MHTFLLMNILRDVHRNSAKAVPVDKAIPKTRTRKAPLTFASVRAFAPFGAFRNAFQNMKIKKGTEEERNLAIFCSFLFPPFILQLVKNTILLKL